MIYTMFIKRVTLKNFKKFKEKSIDFRPELSLLVGGNNEGKSSILHALAVWEFCKTFLVINKGEIAIQQTKHIDGVGMNIDDFTPINIPELKYLWTNLKPSSGYNLSIKCEWNDNKFLEIGLALSNDRLFVKALSSNIIKGDKIPTIAYLPPFAGITDKEVWHYPAQRQKLIGQGLAGSVLRNTIIDMYNANQEKRQEYKKNKSKISSKDLKSIRDTDPYEILNSVLFDTFQCQLSTQKFDLSFHQYIHVNVIKGEKNGARFKPYSTYTARDIMTEGSGFLQWLSVYTYALNKDIDVLLLDEPDAHLHCSLQTQLFSKLNNIVEKNHRQIIVATHSNEIIKNAPYERLMDINEQRCEYLSNPKQVIKILSGLGSKYSPILESIVKTKRILFVENDSDAKILQSFAKKLEITWPTNLTIWPTASKHDYRNHVIDILKQQVDGVAMLSLIDRDNSDYKTITKKLIDKSYSDKKDGNFTYAKFRKWRRSEIENYLLNINVLARATNNTEQDVQSFFQTTHNINLPETKDFIKSDVQTNTKTLFDMSGKEFVNSFCNNYKLTKYDIIEAFKKEEICIDIQTIILEICDMCN